MPDTEAVIGQVVPAVGAAVAAYGTGVLTRAEDAAVNATANLGRRMLQRVLHRAAHPDRLKSAVADLAASREDPDALAALRLQIRAVVTQAPELVTELAALLPTTSQATATGERSVAVGGTNTGSITTGDRSPIGGRE
jgi:hypothetical protein